MRARDVYRFCYSKQELAKRFEPYHCFDGQLVAFEGKDGFYLQDTYWLYRFKPRSGAGLIFTPERAAQEGALTIICNLDDVNEIREGETQYFDDGDVFNLSYQHNSYPYYAVRKGAKRSAGKMLLVLAEKEREQRSRLECAASELQRIAVARQRIQDGHVDEVWLP